MQALESIYVYETIDVKSVRRIARDYSQIVGTPLVTPHTQDNSINKETKEGRALQLEFSFGGQFGGGLPHLALDEPLDVLRLTMPAMRLLKGAGKQTVRDVVQLIKSKEKLSHTGIQQEIDRSVTILFGGINPLDPQPRVDWASLLRSVLFPLAQRQRVLLARQYKIDGLFQFTPHEIREADLSLSRGNRQQINQLLLECRFTVSRQLLDSIQKLFYGYIYNWLMSRHGIESEGEIQEALWSVVQIEGIVFQKREFEASLQLLRDILEKSFIFEMQLIHLKKGIWAISPSFAAVAHQVIQEAELFWRDAGPICTLDSLSDLIFRKNFPHWDCPSKELIKHVLLLAETS